MICKKSGGIRHGSLAFRIDYVGSSNCSVPGQDMTVALEPFYPPACYKFTRQKRVAQIAPDIYYQPPSLEFLMWVGESGSQVFCVNLHSTLR